MPKVEEFYHIYNKSWSATRRKRLRCASETIILGIFIRFSSFVVVNTLYRFKTVPSHVKCFFEIGSSMKRLI